MENKDNAEMPPEIVDKPALQLCWRGLAISISEGQMTRKQAYEMLHSWDKDAEPLAELDHLHDIGPDGDAAA